MGVASFFCIHQSHTDSPLYHSHLLRSISQSLHCFLVLMATSAIIILCKLERNECLNVSQTQQDEFIYQMDTMSCRPVFLCSPSINIIPCSDTLKLLDIISLWCSGDFCSFFFGGGGVWWWTAVIYFQFVILYIFQTFEWPTVNLLLSAVGVECRWGEWSL